MRQNSTGGLKQRRTTREVDQPVKDRPPPLPTRLKSENEPSLSLSRPVPKPFDTHEPPAAEQLPTSYQNSTADASEVDKPNAGKDEQVPNQSLQDAAISEEK